MTVVTVAYNSAEAIASTIEAAEAAIAHLDGEVVVIDNASADGTAAAVPRSPTTRVFSLDENVGYGPGVNQGARRARGRRLLIINDDILLDRSAVDTLLDVLDSSPDIAMVGARITDAAGNVSAAFRNHLPGWGDELARIRDKLTRTDRRHQLSADESREIDVALLLAACVVVDAELFRSIGGFNERFFLYGEDIDFCRRLEHLGLRRVLALDAVAVHNQEISPERRPRGRDFMDRILNARDGYYRIWLSRPSRMLMNLWRSIGFSDQPQRALYHLRRAVRDGGSLRELRTPPPLTRIDEEEASP